MSIKEYCDRNNISYDIEELNLTGVGITDVSDIEILSNIKFLILNSNKLLNGKLKVPKTVLNLKCCSCNLFEIDFNDNTIITDINISDNHISNINNIPDSITIFTCWGNNLEKIMFNGNKLYKLNCIDNNLNCIIFDPNYITNFTCLHNNLPYNNLQGYKKWYSRSYVENMLKLL